MSDLPSRSPNSAAASAAAMMSLGCPPLFTRYMSLRSRTRSITPLANAAISGGKRARCHRNRVVIATRDAAQRIENPQLAGLDGTRAKRVVLHVYCIVDELFSRGVHGNSWYVASDRTLAIACSLQSMQAKSLPADHIQHNFRVAL